MVKKPTYAELEQRIQELTKEESDRIQAKAALRESNEKNLSILNSIEDSYLEVDLSGNFQFFNDSFCKLLGLSRNELIGRNYQEFVDEPTANTTFQTFQNVYKTRKPVKEVSWEYIRKDGTKRGVEGSVSLVTDSKDKRIGFRGIARDFTDRKKTEKALRESEEKHRTFLENYQGIAYQSNYRSFKPLMFEGSVEEITGYQPDEFLSGKIPWNTIIHPEDIQSFIDEGGKFGKEDGFKADFEYRILRKDGDVRWVRDVAQLIKVDEFPVIQGTLIDITDRTQAEKALRESEERYQTLFSKMLDGFALHEIICDSANKPMDYRFLAVNPAFERMTGLEAGAIVGKTVLEILPNTESHWIETYGKVAQDGEPVFFENYSKELGKHFEVSAFQPEPNQFVCVFADITERKKMEVQLQQAQKMESIGTLAGGIAHDFNNILFPIVGNTEMLLEDIPEDSPLRHNLSEVYSGAMRARDLVKQILTFSRQDRHEAKLMRMQPVIEDALKLIRSTIPASIEIKQTISKDCGIVKADSTQIHQVVMNLATNAYHAIPDTDGELKVSLKEIELGEHEVIYPEMEPGLYACLTVADTGVGMDKDLAEKIFDPFFTTKKEGKGTGLGLSVVYGIVHNAGGNIHVDSEPDKGTEIHVYLPIEESSFKQQETQTKEPVQGGTEQILLVDDENAIISMEKQMLERLGYSVVSRTSSVEALEAFRANPDKFDLVITDMAMPNMSGEKLASELIKIRPGIPILLCTGFSEKMPEEKAKTLGIRGFLMKPIVRADLSKKIREVLDEGQ
jgi:PAS domain S-box-containing protein